MKKTFQALKILTVALVLIAGINYVSATYTPKPTTFSPANNTISPLLTNSAEFQTRYGGKLALGTTAPPISLLDVRGSVYAKGLASFGYTNVGPNCVYSCPSTQLDSPSASGTSTLGGLVLKNLQGTDFGKPGVRKLCADATGVLILCPPAHGEILMTTIGSHTFNPQNELPAGVKKYKIEIWGGGGNSVPSTDNNAGNGHNHTNPADPSFVVQYINGVKAVTMSAMAGQMGNYNRGGPGGGGSATGTSATIVNGTPGQDSRFYVNWSAFPLIPSILSTGFNPTQPSLPALSASQCLGGYGGTSAQSPGTTYGGIGGAGGNSSNGSTGKEGTKFGSGGGGRGNLYASGVACGAPWHYTNDDVNDWKNLMSGGGGAGGYVAATFDWDSNLSPVTRFAIEVGEGGKLVNRDYGSGNGANGAARISW